RAGLEQVLRPHGSAELDLDRLVSVHGLQRSCGLDGIVNAREQIRVAEHGAAAQRHLGDQLDARAQRRVALLDGTSLRKATSCRLNLGAASLDEGSFELDAL